MSGPPPPGNELSHRVAGHHLSPQIFSGTLESGCWLVYKTRGTMVPRGFGTTYEGDYLTQNEAQNLDRLRPGYAIHP
jgi:hypothetical protein